MLDHSGMAFTSYLGIEGFSVLISAMMVVKCHTNLLVDHHVE